MKNNLITEEIIFWVKLESNIKYICIIFVAANVGAFRHSYRITTEKKASTTGRYTRKQHEKYCNKKCAKVESTCLQLFFCELVLIVCFYICIYARTHARTYVYMYVCMYVRTYARTHALMHACMYVCMYARMYICMMYYVCMYVCMYWCMYVYVQKTAPLFHLTQRVKLYRGNSHTNTER